MLNDIKGFIETDLLSGRPIDSRENLLLSGLVDSLGIMRLVSYIEAHYGFKIPAGDVKLANFKTLEAIVDYVAARSAQ